MQHTSQVMPHPTTAYPTLTLAEFQSLAPLDFGDVKMQHTGATSFLVYHPGILPIDISFTLPAQETGLSLSWRSTASASTPLWCALCVALHLLA